ncbi:MAG: hypothetical protein AB7O86_12305 [Porticoccaceae bacterium]
MAAWFNKENVLAMAVNLGLNGIVLAAVGTWYLSAYASDLRISIQLNSQRIQQIETGIVRADDRTAAEKQTILGEIKALREDMTRRIEILDEKLDRRPR